MIKKEADFLFEVSWEICNKVGGIYTVVRSKIAPTLQYYKKNYYAIGPYFVDKATGEFQEMIAPVGLRDVFAKLKEQGIICHYGVWLVSKEPQTILIDFSGYAKNKDSIKKELWDRFKIDSLGTEFHDFDESVVWSYCVGKLIEEISSQSDKKIVAQFHEWLSGAGLLYLKSRGAKVGTIFTTHATMLGRTMTGNNRDLYGQLGRIDSNKVAYELGIQAKHQMETQCANNADVFTTVSEITGIEAESLLGRKPDVLLPNGLDIDKFPTFEEASIKHRLFREKIREFLMYYFFPHYTFDIDKTLVFFIAGRYEFHDKGVDIFIRSLARLNERLKKEKSDKTIVAFFWVPGNIRGIKQELLESKTLFEDVKDSVDDSLHEIGERVLYALMGQKKISAEFLLGPDVVQENKKQILKLTKRSGNPLLSTHDLHNGGEDLILQGFRQNNLLNKEEDKVKVVFYPIYLTGADRLLDTTYYESMQGSHVGVFPSYYEPWGYNCFIDLYDFVEKLKNQTDSQEIKDACQLVLDSMDEAIMANEALPSDPSHGLSIYFPTFRCQYDKSIWKGLGNPTFNKISSYRALEFSKDTQWNEFVEKYLLIFN